MCDGIEYKKVKVSTFGSYEEVKKISACYHEWVWRPSLLFGYMKVLTQCVKCKTWWVPPEDNA